MYHPTTRVLTVLELLQVHQRMSGRDLAQRLEVNIRTVRHYITMLQDMGIPIEAERGRHGAYRLRPGFKLPPLLFNEDEAVALTLGLLTARRLGLTVAAPAVEGALAKVERVLPEATRARVQSIQETLVIDFSSPYAVPSSGVVATLSTAAQQRRRVELRYRSWQGSESARAFDSYGLVYHDGRWFAAGHCHLRAEPRVFRVDRVLQVDLRDETFTRPDGFDMLAFVLHSLATTPGRWQVEVLLRTTLAEARQCVPPTLATLDETPEGVVLRCAVQQLDWFAHFLAGLCCPLVVRQPAELRAALRQLAGAIARLAETAEDMGEQEDRKT
jgi:predicted DNA-binding transcriptional regulator YafY